MPPRKDDDINSNNGSTESASSGSTGTTTSYESYDYDSEEERREEQEQRARERARMRLQAKSRRGYKKIIDTPWFHSMVGGVVIANAAIIGFETDFGECRGSCTVAERGLWYILDASFTFCFTAEMLVRMYVCGFATTPEGKKKMLYFYDPWNRFDFLVVMCAILDTLILSWLPDMGGILKIMTVLRIVRIFRLVRVVRLVPLFRELYLIISGMIDAIKTVVWVVVVLALILFVAAIYITMAVGKDLPQPPDSVLDSEEPNAIRDWFYKGDVYTYGSASKWNRYDYWGTVGHSMFTLFQLITGDNWVKTLARPILHRNPEMIFFFLLIIFVVSFGLLNIILGVIVENTMAAAARNTAKISRILDRSHARVANSLREIFEAGDTDGTGSLDAEEFAVALKKPHVKDKLNLIDVPVSEMSELFGLLDSDGSGSVTIEEFNKGLMLVKGTAKSKELINLTMHVKAYNRYLDGLIEDVDDQNELLEKIFHRLFCTEREFRSVDAADEVDTVPSAVPRRQSIAVMPAFLMEDAEDDPNQPDAEVPEAPPLPPHILEQMKRDQEAKEAKEGKSRRNGKKARGGGRNGQRHSSKEVSIASDSSSSAIASGLSSDSDSSRDRRPSKRLSAAVSARWGLVRAQVKSKAGSKSSSKEAPREATGSTALTQSVPVGRDDKGPAPSRRRTAQAGVGLPGQLPG